MALVNRLLDVFFRTLDAVDAAREKVERARGHKKPDPWSSDWQPTPEPSPPVATRAPPAVSVPKAAPAPSSKAPKASAKTAKAAPKKTAAKKASGSKRKGSVDRKGTDFDSPRARAIVAKLQQKNAGVITDDADLKGKKVLARVLWALEASEKAGSELGLTAADASALLGLAAQVEVFSTNVARTCRDETDFIVESAPDGRSKRYKLTDQGRAAAGQLAVRPIS
jgi:hypothetical protein